MASSLSEQAMLAGRYAKAVFETAEEQRSLDAVEADLRNVQQAIHESPEFEMFLRHPLLGMDEQKQSITEILSYLKANKLTRDFFNVLVENRRLIAVPRIIEAFLSRAAKLRGEVKATLVSSHKLDNSFINMIADTLAKQLKVKVLPEARVNSDILGGIVIQVGSRVLDASVRTQLEKLEKELKQSVEAVAL